MVQRGGTEVAFSSTERTRPVTVLSPVLIVAARPLNCAMRKRRTSFWSAVSKLNMKLSCASCDYGRSLLARYENRQPYKYGWAARCGGTARGGRCREKEQDGAA